MITFRKAALGGLAIAATGAVLAGCASAPSPSTETTAAGSDFLPCMVSDTGGFDDHSFNELGADGIKEAGADLGVEPILVESKTDSDYGPNLQALVDRGCTYIVSVGFNLSAATVEAALANPDVYYAIIDDAADNDGDGKVDAPNIKPILSDTAQAAFLGGYAAAAYSKTGAVGTFGGIPIPPVTIFMDGFAQGVDYYNKETGKSVKVVGWDEAAQDGSFTGGFEANDTARATAQSVIDQGVDVLLPVGGPIYQSGAAAIRDSGKDIALIGVDADVYLTDPSVADLLLTSIQKQVGEDVKAAVEEGAAGNFSSDAYIGTLENGGVGLAPFHDFASKVPSDLQSKIDSLKADIISGKITVKSYLS